MPSQNLPSNNLSDVQQPLIPPSTTKPHGGAAVERLSIDDMLQKYSGEFGRWQLRHFILTSLAWALEAFHTMVMIFADREPDWLCTGPSCPAQSMDICGLSPGSWEWAHGPDRSTVSEWGLICGDKFKIGLAQALFFGGCMIGYNRTGNCQWKL